MLADRVYLVLHRNNLTVEIQMELSQKQKTFSEFFSPFLKSVWRFEHFFKKEDSHRFYISEFTESKNLVRLIPKKSRFRGPFEKQHGKRAQALLKSASQHVYHILWPLETQLTWKKCLLLTCQILGVLVNTLATDEKCPLLKRDNLTLPIQIQLSKKQKSFCQFFAPFLKSSLNFKYFEKKDDPHRFCISEITVS